MRYLSGFRGTDGYLLLTPERKVLLTDSRYTTQAKEEAPGFEVMETKSGRGYKEILAELLGQAAVKRLLFEDKHLIYADVLELKEHCAGVEWKPAGDLLNSLREVKTERELALIQKAECYWRPGVCTDSEGYPSRCDGTPDCRENRLLYEGNGG